MLESTGKRYGMGGPPPLRTMSPIKALFYGGASLRGDMELASKICDGTLTPYSPRFLTCGYDGSVILWDGVAHTDLWSVQVGFRHTSPGPVLQPINPQLNGKARCCAVSPDGGSYAVGTLGGALHCGLLESTEHTLQVPPPYTV